MKKVTWVSIIRFFVSSIFIVLIGATLPAYAQDYAEGISYITTATTSTDLYTVSQTYITYDLQLYYSPQVAAQILDNGTQIVEGSDSPGGGQLAELDGTVPNEKIGDTYEIDADHYLLAIYEVSDGNGGYYFDNPGGYGFIEGTQPSGYQYDPGSPDYVVEEEIYLGSTAYAISTAAPKLSGISPQGDVRGKSSGTITLTGQNLLDVLNQSTTPAVSGSGVHLSISGTPSATQVTLNYSIDQNATDGAHQVTIATRFGVSNGESFTVGDPSPVVNSVSPPLWNAGNVIPLTITGTGFGTNPSVTISGAGVLTPTPSASGVSDTQLTTSVTIDPNAPNGPAAVQVQSHGISGSGFVQGTPGQSSSGSTGADIQAKGAQQPTIIVRSSNPGNCSSGSPITSQTVVVGQPISITGCIPSNGGATISGSSWTPDGQFANATVGGFVITHTKVGTMDQFTESIPSANAPTCGANASCDFATFYFKQAGTYNFSFQYSLQNGQSSSPQTVTFTVSAPTAAGDGTFISAATLLADVWNEEATGNGFWLMFGLNSTLAGIQFSATATPPNNNGAWLFTQLLSGRSDEHLLETGTLHYVEPDGLDTLFPYPSSTNGHTADSPGTQLDQQATPEGEAYENFGATMYLLWDPQTPPAGQQTCFAASSTFSAGTVTYIPSNCASVPVPVASTTWGWSATAIKTLDPTQTNTQGVLVGTWYSPTHNVLTPQNGPAGYPMWNVTSGAKARHLQ